MRFLQRAFGLTVLLLASTGTAAPDGDESAFLGELAAEELGVTDDGSLWAWWRSKGQVKVFGPAGEERLTLRVNGNPSAIDVHPEWGVAVLDDLGLELLIVRPSGQRLPSLALPHAVSAVTWLGKNLVAVAPDRAAHRVEIWNVEQARLVRRLGRETAIDDDPGALFLRRVELEYDPHQDRLYTLDSRTGELSVFNLQGARIGQVEVTNPRRAELDAWLAEVDARARATGDVQRPSLAWFRLTLDAEGKAWTVQQCTDGKARVVGFQPDASDIEALEVPTPCCSLDMVAWQGLWVFNQPPSSQQQGCVAKVSRSGEAND